MLLDVGASPIVSLPYQQFLQIDGLCYAIDVLECMVSSEAVCPCCTMIQYPSVQAAFSPPVFAEYCRWESKSIDHRLEI